MATSRMIPLAVAANPNPTYHRTPITSPADDIFEFDDSDVWTSTYHLSTVFVPNNKLQTSSSVRKFNAGGGNRAPAAASASSLPVNIPEWSKIREKGRSKESDGEEEESGYVEAEHRIPPHEYLAMRRGASFSVHEGAGRTLKGRDLRQVRNAVWKRVGFED